MLTSRPGDFPSIWDSSILNEFKECPEKFSKGTIHWWKPKTHSVHLHAGAAFAHGVERARRAFYEESLDAETSVASGLQALLSFYGDFAYPEDSAKTPERMAGALEYYFDNYPLLKGESDPIVLPGGKLGIEFGFVEPLEICHPATGDPILYSGRMDAILNYAGSILLTDEKTTSSLGATWSRQWDLRGQFTGYAWGCHRNGIRVDGALIRGVSILKTKYETQQAITYRPEWQISRWFTEANEWIEEAAKMWLRGRFRHNLGETCSSFGGCAFKQACQSQEEKPWLETYFEQRHWNPVLRTETLVETPQPAEVTKAFEEQKSALDSLSP